MDTVHNTRENRDRTRLWRQAQSTSWRLTALAVCAVLSGILAGLILPRLVPTVGTATGRGVAPAGRAARMLAALNVEKPHSTSGYDRDLFAFRSTDDDGNGCDVRQDVLTRDLTDVVHDTDGCTVVSGHLDDPYTGRGIDFHKGKNTSAAVQIDHIVALRNAWISGADEWDAATRIRYANDTDNLLAVQGEANQEKSDASADNWLPPNESFHCVYVTLQITAKYRYSLSVTPAEHEAMGRILATCPADKTGETGGAPASSAEIDVAVIDAHENAAIAVGSPPVGDAERHMVGIPVDDARQAVVLVLDPDGELCGSGSALLSESDGVGGGGIAAPSRVLARRAQAQGVERVDAVGGCGRAP